MISKQEIEKLATLARIKLSEAEKESLTKDIDSVLGYIDQVKKAAGGEAREILDLVHNVMRNDQNAHESGTHTTELLEAAPQTENGYIKVKKILQ